VSGKASWKGSSEFKFLSMNNRLHKEVGKSIFKTKLNTSPMYTILSVGMRKDIAEMQIRTIMR
jgi:hypothetical protein